MAEEIRIRPVAEVMQAGPGSQPLAVSVHNGQVVIHFESPCEWSAFDPESARRFAEQVARFAYQAHYGRAPSEAENRSFMAQGVRQKMTKALREKMVNRTVMLLRNWAEQKPPLPYQAEQIVDHVLKEVL